MNKPNLSRFFRDVKVVLSDHSPEILTGIGIAGMVSTTVLAVKATPKALVLIENEKNRQNRERMNEAINAEKESYSEISKLTPVEVIKVAWKCYIPSIALGAASIACLIGASSVSLKRNAALATAYKLSETAFAEYKAKVVETIGEKKERTVQDKIYKEHVEKNRATNNEIIITGGGETLFMDYQTGRFFNSSIDKIDKVVNQLNRQMTYNMEPYVSLNDFYDAVGLERVDLGKDMGWNVDKGLIDRRISTQIVDDKPCIVLDFSPSPQYNYWKVS